MSFHGGVIKLCIIHVNKYSYLCIYICIFVFSYMHTVIHCNTPQHTASHSYRPFKTNILLDVFALLFETQKKREKRICIFMDQMQLCISVVLFQSIMRAHVASLYVVAECCYRVLLQCSVAVYCCSVLLQCIVAVYCCSVLLRIM